MGCYILNYRNICLRWLHALLRRDRRLCAEIGPAALSERVQAIGAVISWRLGVGVVFAVVTLSSNVSRAEFMLSAPSFGVAVVELPSDVLQNEVGLCAIPAERESDGDDTPRSEQEPLPQAPGDQVRDAAADFGGETSSPTVESQSTGVDAHSAGGSGNAIAVESAFGSISLFDFLFPPTPIPLSILDPPKNFPANPS
jgi:hypothetical protein